MKIRRGYKVELDLTNKHITACLKHAGCARFAWNWGLARKQHAYQCGHKIPTAVDLSKELNALKARDYPWMYEVSKCAPQEALRDLDAAYTHAYRRLREKKAGRSSVKVGWPRFKARNKGIGGFRLNGCIHLFEEAIQLPRLGMLRLQRARVSTRGCESGASHGERAGWQVVCLCSSRARSGNHASRT